jgi:hypothetical protein
MQDTSPMKYHHTFDFFYYSSLIAIITRCPWCDNIVLCTSCTISNKTSRSNDWSNFIKKLYARSWMKQHSLYHVIPLSHFFAFCLKVSSWNQLRMSWIASQVVSRDASCHCPLNIVHIEFPRVNYAICSSTSSSVSDFPRATQRCIKRF